MKDKIMKDKINTAAKILFPTYGLSAMVVQKVMDSSIISQEILKQGNRKEIENELFRKTAEAKIFELEAKVNQELAIAKRIENAIDVEIEEYFEVGGSGKIGGNVGKDSVGVDISGDGRKIVKRIYKFKGKKDDIES